MRRTDFSPIPTRAAQKLASIATPLLAVLVCFGACSRPAPKRPDTAPQSREDQIQTWADRAASYRRRGEPAKAREAANIALGLLQPATTRDDPQICRIETIIGKSFAMEGQTALSIEHYRRALAAAARHPDQMRPDLVASHIALSAALLSAGDTAAGTSSAEDALAAAERPRKSDAVTHGAITNLAAIYVKAGRSEDALRLLTEKRGLLRRWHLPAAKPESGPLTEAMLQPKASGQIFTSDLDVRLSDIWAYCASKSRAAGLETVGTARVTATVAIDGSVSEVTSTSFGLSEHTTDCMVLETAATRFPRPEGPSAVIVFATETFP